MSNDGEYQTSANARYRKMMPITRTYVLSADLKRAQFCSLGMHHLRRRPPLSFPSLNLVRAGGLHLIFHHRQPQPFHRRGSSFVRPSVHCHRRRRRRFQSQCPWPMVSPAAFLPPFPSPTPTSKVCHNLDYGRRRRRRRPLRRWQGNGCTGLPDRMRVRAS